MSKIYTSADQLIGHTPLLELTHIEKEQPRAGKPSCWLSWNTSIPPVPSRTASQRQCWTMPKLPAS